MNILVLARILEYNNSAQIPIVEHRLTCCADNDFWFMALVPCEYAGVECCVSYPQTGSAVTT